MMTLNLFATHAKNVAESLGDELMRIGAKICKDESCSSKTTFSMDIDESLEGLLRLRSLRYADDVYLKIYHNRMHPSKEHPDCPV
ncbi:unnamed protein product, partial [Strongylus vulgaris]